jgi:hypothetical protein
VDGGDKEYGQKKIGFEYLLMNDAAKNFTVVLIVESGALIHVICALHGAELARKWSVHFHFL